MSIRPPATVVASEANDQLLYFTSTSLLADDQRIVYLSDRTGQPNIFLRDLRTGKDRQLTFNTEGFLKSYVTARLGHESACPGAEIISFEDVDLKLLDSQNQSRLRY